MSFLSQLWDGIKDLIAGGIDLLHTGLEPIFGMPSWGWAIIALTVVVRVVMIPLAVKQFHSMRAMQELQPQIKAIQAKYKTDRSMMRSDPERYRKIQSNKNEELQALYKEHDVNPVAGCLPLLAQGPIFFALYSVLRDPNTLGGRLSEASFYVFDSLGVNISDIPEGGIAGYLTPPGLWGLLLVVGVAASMFVSQKQMMGRRQPSSSQGDVQATQQKVMLYAMPAMMGFFGFQLPVGVLLYWVTTNLWTMAQQAFIMREATEDAGSSGGSPGGGPSSNGDGTGSAGNVRRPAADVSDDGDSPPKEPTKPKEPKKGKSRRPRDDESRDEDSEDGESGQNGSGRRSSHLPTRPSRRK